MTFIFILVIIIVAVLAFMFGIAIGKKDTKLENSNWLNVPPPNPFDDAR